jgi:DNA polymerase III delta prime subunit
MFDPTVRNYLDRFANSKKRPNTFLFFGPAGTGKTDAVFYLIQKMCAKNINETFLERLKGGTHPDIVLIEPEIVEDKKGNIREKEITVEQVRHAQQQLKYFPYELDYKFCIIKKAERLNPEASNALLKNLEEPSEKTLFFLLTLSAETVLPTIASRSALLRFPQKNLSAWKEENRESLRKIFLDEIHEKFFFAEKISKNKNESAQVLSDWEKIIGEGLRKMAGEQNPENSKKMKKTAAILSKNRKALNKIESSNANPRSILENLLLELQW